MCVKTTSSVEEKNRRFGKTLTFCGHCGEKVVTSLSFIFTNPPEDKYKRNTKKKKVDLRNQMKTRERNGETWR